MEQDGDGSSLSLMDVLSSHDRGLEQVDNSDQGQLLFRALQTLEPREREIIRLRYGLTGQPPLTQRETAKRYGISRSYISRIPEKSPAQAAPRLGIAALTLQEQIKSDTLIMILISHQTGAFHETYFLF